MLKKLSIEHYRGFYDEQSIAFAVPDNAKNGSGLTLIVGPNNTGKTTLLECLLFTAQTNQKKFEKPERHTGYPPQITIESDTGTAIFTNIDDGSQISKSGECNVVLELIPSRRHWNSASGSDWASNTFLEQTTAQSVRNAGSLDTAAFLKQINRNPPQKQKFNDILKQVIPHFTGWTIDSENGDYVEYRTALASHKAHFSGDGIISIFRICAHLVADDIIGRILIIDEPELSLHPTAQKALAKIISTASKERQIIVCTHSPHFANWDDFLNGAKFVRLNKPDDKHCQISMLDNQKPYTKFIANNYMEWQKPQLLDYVAKEILFAERVLFVEGQEDMGLIKNWLIESNTTMNCEIFGYGVGGFGNMGFFLEVAKDLGIDKAAVLYDRGPDTYKDWCKNRKFRGYKFAILPTVDIRDKFDENGILKKEGCFNKSGVLKEERKQKFESIMKKFIDYFSL